MRALCVNKPYPSPVQWMGDGDMSLNIEHSRHLSLASVLGWRYHRLVRLVVEQREEGRRKGAGLASLSGRLDQSGTLHFEWCSCTRSNGKKGSRKGEMMSYCSWVDNKRDGKKPSPAERERETCQQRQQSDVTILFREV